MKHGLVLPGIGLFVLLVLAPAHSFADPEGDPGVSGAPDVAPQAALATGPTLDCRVIGLRIMAPEVSGVRVICHVADALPADTSFGIFLVGRPEAICTAQLTNGVGECAGSAVDRAASAIGPLTLSASLQPSGSAIGPVSVGLPAQPVEPPMQFYPLPED